MKLVVRGTIDGYYKIERIKIEFILDTITINVIISPGIINNRIRPVISIFVSFMMNRMDRLQDYSLSFLPVPVRRRHCVEFCFCRNNRGANLRTITDLDNAVYKDDVEQMDENVTPGFQTQDQLTHLLVHACYYDARNCFKRLLQKVSLFGVCEDNMKRVYFAAITTRCFFLKELIDSGCIDLSRAAAWYWGLHQTGLHWSNKHLYDSSTELKETIRCLLSIGADPWARDGIGKLPIDLLYLPASHLRCSQHTVIMDAARDLLTAMELSRGTCRFLIPLESIMTLHKTFHTYHYVDKSLKVDPSADLWHSTQTLMYELMELLLTAGADLTERSVAMVSPLNPSTSLDFYDRQTFGGLLNEAVLPALISNPATNGDKLLVLKQYYSLLLSYGSQPDKKWFLFLYLNVNLKPKHLMDIVECCLSMMEPEIFHSFQRYMKVYHNITDYNFCLSLKDQCRRVLYQNIPHRRMAVHVTSLPLPKPLQKFLIFDRELKESVDLKV